MSSFRWNGKGRVEDAKLWLQSADGSEHGWPQLTDLEAQRLCDFLQGAADDITRLRIAIKTAMGYEMSNDARVFLSAAIRSTTATGTPGFDSSEQEDNK